MQGKVKKRDDLREKGGRRKKRRREEGTGNEGKKETKGIRKGRGKEKEKK